jgi:Fic family protein
MGRTTSKLVGHEETIRSLRAAGKSYRSIAAVLEKQHGVAVSHNAIYSFLRVRDRRRQEHRMFYDGLPDDIRQSLLRQFSVLWTHDSTAIEGNTLTLGETARVLELGLTISGKPLKDHEEVYGHARAIDLILEMLAKEKLKEVDLFNLHRCVMQTSPIDSLRPVGDWKREYNGTTGIRDGRPVYMEYTSPEETPKLMRRWLRECNRKLGTASTSKRAINVYAWMHMTFVRIHPFFDGNGRVARLIANLPLLRGGFPPLMIAVKDRAEYLDCLWNYQNAVGTLRAGDRLLPSHPQLHSFKHFLKRQWRQSFGMVETARQQVAARTQGQS